MFEGRDQNATEGQKTGGTDRFVESHIRVGIEALELLRRQGRSVKHLRFDD